MRDMVRDKAYIGAIFFLAFAVFSPSVMVSAQSANDSGFKNELTFTLVNDNFTPPFRDRYFTHGLSITFSRALKRRLLWENIFWEEPVKSVLQVSLTQEIYTPESIIERDAHEYDRPYAGYLFTNTSLHTHWKRRNSLFVTLTTGIIGPKAGGAKVQEWWHGLINLSEPIGWENQVSNEAVVNLGLQYQRAILEANRFDIISAIGGQAGTAFNTARLGTMLRLGNIDPKDRSAIAGRRFGGYGASTRAVNYHRKNEWFLFLELSNAFVFHNALIKGNFFKISDSSLTKEPEPYFTTLKAGAAFSTTLFTWIFTAYQLSPEVKGGGTHNYASIEMAVRF